MSEIIRSNKKLLNSIDNLTYTEDWQDLFNLSPERWRFQIEFIQNAIDYWENEKNADEPNAAIIKMPTGSGKTSIFTILANFPKIKKTLVIVPSEGLKIQTIDYMNAIHWQKVKIRPKNIARAVVFQPESFFSFVQGLEKNEYDVGVCTTATLDQIFKKYKAKFIDLCRQIELVIVDEGHREPARAWSKAVRGIKKPTVLFSATPYRNDLRFFMIGKDTHGDTKKFLYRKELTYYEALKNGTIRNVVFTNKQNYCKYVKQNVKWEPDIKLYFESLDDIIRQISIKVDEPKIIIHCDSQENIIEVANYIKDNFMLFSSSTLQKIYAKNGDEERPVFVAFHEKFTNKDGFFDKVSRVTKSKQWGKDKNIYNNAIFWIHQYKLIEGVDDPNFIMISFFNDFSNARSVVQQIGRVVRNPASIKQDNCYVHADNNYNIRDFWEGYLNYENVSEDEKQNRIYGTEEIVERITRSFPEWFYFDRKFSNSISSNPNELDLKSIIAKDLRIPKATTLFVGNLDKGDIKECLESLSEWLLDNDIILLKMGVLEFEDIFSKEELGSMESGRGFLGAYIGYEVKPSDFLNDSIFFDIKLVTCTLLAIKNFVFFRGNSVEWAKEGFKREDNEINFEKIDIEQLQNLLCDESSKFEVKQASFINSDPNKFCKRRRSEGGRDLSQTASYLDDHLHALTTIYCKIDQEYRYIGLTKGRVTDGKGKFLRTFDYIAWANQIADALVNGEEKKKIDYISRFSIPRVITDDTSLEPRHIACDYRQIGEDYRNLDIEGLWNIAFEEDSLTFDETYTYKSFRLKNLEQYLGIDETELRLVFSNGKYYIQPTDNEVTIDVNGSKKLLDKILKNSIIIYLVLDLKNPSDTLDKNHIDTLFYVEDQFYSISVPLWGNNRINALGIILGLDELAETTCEKCPTDYSWQSDMQTWPIGSIFSILDSLYQESIVDKLNAQTTDIPFFIPEVILCPDSSKEMGDFIIYSNSSDKKKIIVIHAKQATKEGTNSAVEFAKIQEQVIKNLRVFDPGSIIAGEIKSQFSGNWNLSGAEVASIPRIRKNSGKTDDEITQDILELVKTGADKEVWIFYGKGFHSDVFIREFEENPDPAYWFKQFAYLLVNTNSACQRAGAKLRVFTQK